ncbi:MAG: ABC transporter substrate-binding protein [Microbacteriaceae bacterium]|nr:ABC transporter substrate-binding protein [Microbacteriaceae bacterium]
MVKTTPAIASLAIAAVAALGLAGCATTGTPAPTDGTASTVDAATATSAGDFGGLEALEAAARAEGALNVIALPRDWANYGAVLDAFMAKYPEITVNEAQPDISSAEEIKAAEDLAGQDTAPDVFDLGLAVAAANTDQFAEYRVAAWDDIPAALKADDARYWADYGGFMSIGYDPDVVPEPKSLEDLLGDEYRGKVALNGDPTQAGAAFAGVGLAAVQNGGSADDFQAGIDFFSELNAAGNFLKVDATPSTIASGEIAVTFDWDYLQAGYAKQLEGTRKWEVTIPEGTGYAGYYYQAINAEAPHPAAARLWQEFLYTAEAQNLWLAGGARPVLGSALEASGEIDAELWGALPAAPTDFVALTPEQSAAAGELLGEKWAAAVQ